MADKNAANGGDKPRPGERHNQRRKATLDQIRREQQRKERRKTVLFISIATVIALAIIGVTVFSLAKDKADKNTPPNNFGVPVAEAGCDAEIADDASEADAQKHVTTRVDYKSAPADFGPHDPNYLDPAKSEVRAFFTAEDRPPVERLVHSLEHGYVLFWYDPSLPQDQLDTIKSLATSMYTLRDKKFIAAPWPGASDNRPAFPEGKRVAFAQWGGNKKAYRQYCSAVSGDAAANFSNAHPISDSPESGAP